MTLTTRTIPAVLLWTLVASQSPAHARGDSEASGASEDRARPAAGASDKQRAAWLSSRIDALVAGASNLGEARVGIAVHDLASGRSIYRNRAATALSHVASNVKILTSSALLARLGPGFRYRTGALADERQIDERGRIAGDLYIRGSGDPTLDVEDLDYLANELALAGITGVGGDLLVDDSYFAGLIDPPHFNDFTDGVDRHARYRAPIGALTVAQGTFEVIIAPSRAGRGPARIAIEPPGAYVQVADNSMLTQARGRPKLDLQMEVVDGRLQLKAAGQIRAGAQPMRFRLRVEDPAIYAGEVLKHQLGRRGIVVSGAVKRAPEGVPAEATILASAASPALSVMLRHLGKRSNNAAAEAMLLTLGAEVVAAPENRPATLDDGLEALRRFLIDDVGLPAKDGAFAVANGSGLYGPTRLSPALIIQVLRHAHADPHYGPDFVASLSLSGVDGTLRRRLGDSGGLIRGKTGTLGSVSALSGFAHAPGAPTLVFSFVMSDLPRDGTAKRQARRSARRLQDELAMTLLAYLGADEPKRQVERQVERP